MLRLRHSLLIVGIFTDCLLSCPAFGRDHTPQPVEQREHPALAPEIADFDFLLDNHMLTQTAIGNPSTKPLTPRTNLPPSTATKTPAHTVHQSAEQVLYNGCQYDVPGAGKFKHKKEFTFTDGLPEGLDVAQYVVEDSYAGAPFDHKFETKNVFVDNNGLLNLKVAGVRRPKPYDGQVISSSEIGTSEKNILYASVRTSAIFNTVPGTCQGIFFYKDDKQETDIEFLSDPLSDANNINQTSADGDPIPLWYSNQALTQGTTATQEIGPAPNDVTEMHEYRIDWTKEFTAFYIDGVLTKKLTTNVPTKPGQWIWNHWANGDQAWSSGPPKKDSFFKIQAITMYYNTSPENRKC